MNEHFFHVQPEAIAQKKFSLSKEEGLHFLKSLRGEIGEQIWLLDAKGIGPFGFG